MNQAYLSYLQLDHSLIFAAFWNKHTEGALIINLY
jgi:hypothetical protein